MSIGREMLTEMIIEYEIQEMEMEKEYIRLKAIFESGYWITKDGKTISISSMKGSHIRNSIKMLERNMENEIYSDVEGDLASIALRKLKQELKKRYPPVDPAFMWG